MLDIDSVTLNRLGIVLNLFAGFLLAPGLIGLKNLEKFEHWLESSIRYLQLKISELNPYEIKQSEELVKPGITPPKVRAEFLRRDFVRSGTFFSIVFWAIFFGIVYLLDFDVILSLFFALAVILMPLTIFFIFEKEENKLLHSIGYMMIIVFLVEIGILIASWILIVPIASTSLRVTLGILEGEKKLVGIMLGIGILFFVLGNLLQLLATFNNK